jgi:tetratricopeptide (TPR) repeat protein
MSFAMMIKLMETPGIHGFAFTSIFLVRPALQDYSAGRQKGSPGDGTSGKGGPIGNINGSGQANPGKEKGILAMKYSIRFPKLTAAFCMAASAVGISTASANAQETPAMARQIQQREAAIKPDDAAGHQRMAQYLYNNRLYDQALQQVNEALKINPNFQNAQLLRNLIENQLRRQSSTRNPSPAAQAANVSQMSTVPTTSGQSLLTMKDVYKIRFWQLQRHETAPIEGKILHRRKTLMAFWRKLILRNPMYQDRTMTRRDYEQFISPNNFNRQIYLIRRLGTPKYWDKVQLKSDPQIMKIFRTDIQPIVLQSCGTIGCHRGQNAPGFRIYGDQGGNNTLKTYTNFLTLTRFRYKNMPLISQQNPRMSLLLQYLKPKELQAYSHPGKIGPMPLKFSETKVINWIESLRYPPHSYGIFNSPAATTRATAQGTAGTPAK